MLSAVSVGTVECLNAVEMAGQVQIPEVGKGRTLADINSYINNHTCCWLKRGVGTPSPKHCSHREGVWHMEGWQGANL